MNKFDKSNSPKSDKENFSFFRDIFYPKMTKKIKKTF